MAAGKHLVRSRGDETTFLVYLISDGEFIPLLLNFWSNPLSRFLLGEKLIYFQGFSYLWS